jgi:NAD(P)-dependent dehydrogenase (short-subunit alcohol dehydrogenase family)
LADRVAIVTGAASGMGRACAEKFASEGWTVGAVDINLAGLDELTNLPGGRIIKLAADVSKADSVAGAFSKLSSEAGPPTVCVNAAAIYPVTTFESADEELYRRIFDINVLGTLLVVKEAAKALPGDATGSIVNFASATVYIPTPVQFLYGASKAAVVHLTRTMAAALAPRFRVNAIAPGWVETEGTRVVRDQMVEEVKAFPIPRPGKPEELAGIVWWLAVDRSAAYITGETLNANGGAVMA